jgi:hypothetical protein
MRNTANTPNSAPTTYAALSPTLVLIVMICSLIVNGPGFREMPKINFRQIASPCFADGNSKEGDDLFEVVGSV